MSRYYSGLVTDETTGSGSIWERIQNKWEIKRNIQKIKLLPQSVRDAVLALPQFEIFFEGSVPYYITKECNIKKRLPQSTPGDLFYDPVKDTDAYKLVIREVQETAKVRYETYMTERFGTQRILGGVHLYCKMEADILYQKYGIRCINDPDCLNIGLHTD